MNLLSELIRNFTSHRNNSQAAKQQQYMKSPIPYYGLTSKERATLHKEVIDNLSRPLTVDEKFEASALILQDVTHRELYYSAIQLITDKDCINDVRILPAIEAIVTHGEWWDTTDSCQKPLRMAMEKMPVETKAQILKWSTHENMWLRRIAIISQLTRKEKVDKVLLTKVIEANLGSKEFFINKAIGWALRDYARVNPEWVKDFISNHQLEKLSKREALKTLKKSNLEKL